MVETFLVRRLETDNLEVVDGALCAFHHCIPFTLNDRLVDVLAVYERPQSRWEIEYTDHQEGYGCWSQWPAR